MSHLVAQLDLTCALGEDRTFAGTHYDSDPDTETDAAVVNITGWTITVTIKNVALTTVTISATVTLGTAGTYTWTLSAAQSVTLGAGVSRMDVWRTNAGAATLMGIGDFNITQEVRV